MKTLAFVAAPLCIGALFAACGAPAEPAPAPPPAKDTVAVEKPAEAPAVIAPANAKLKLVVAPPAAQFPDAALKLNGTSVDAKKGEATYTFAVSGYELKAQTPDAPTRGCANSKDGQHIHYILNNKPYVAKYEPTFTEKGDPGHNVVLCFLSRSYHESLKHNNSVVLTEFDLPGGNAAAAKADLKKDPTLFYSRPKGDYKKLDGDKVLLDFYLLNTDLADKGYRVRATIDGEVWMLTKWDAYFIEGLELGKHTVRLELIDANGQLVPGPFNDSGVREFNFLAS
ncbi:MAG: phosphopeptide-binding protein [Bacteroidetes bacterium]|nr:phosphopeptide-binding protein [Bacteroidota bacterium]